MNLMIREIRETPDVLQRLIEAEFDRAKKFIEFVKKEDYDAVTFVARGTSDNACLYGKYLLETLINIPSHLAAPSVVTVYKRYVKSPKTLVVGVSQSGESTDVIEYMTRAHEKGSLTVAITNTTKSTLAKCSDKVFYLHAGREEAVAATKTYSAEVTMLYMLAALWSGRKALIDAIPAIPETVGELLKMEEEVKDRTERYRFIDRAVVLGRGYNFATAKEGALKLMETCYLPAQAFSMADFMHGPIAMIHKGFPTILFVNRGKMGRPMLNLAKDLASKYTESIIFSNTKETKRYANTHFLMPSSLPEETCPITYIIPTQFFAYYLSVLRGVDPDNPQYLKKITLTM